MDKSEDSFYRFASDTLSDMLDKLENKGKQYSSGTNALENLEDGSTIAGTTPEHYAMTLATKHWHALVQWSMGRRPGYTFEDVQERATDIMIYMLLLMFSFKTKENE